MFGCAWSPRVVQHNGGAGMHVAASDGISPHGESCDDRGGERLWSIQGHCDGFLAINPVQGVGVGGLQKAEHQ